MLPPFKEWVYRIFVTTAVFVALFWWAALGFVQVVLNAH